MGSNSGQSPGSFGYSSPNGTSSAAATSEYTPAQLQPSQDTTYSETFWFSSQVDQSTFDAIGVLLVSSPTHPLGELTGDVLANLLAILGSAGYKSEFATAVGNSLVCKLSLNDSGSFREFETRVREAGKGVFLNYPGYTISVGACRPGPYDTAWLAPVSRAYSRAFRTQLDLLADDARRR